MLALLCHLLKYIITKYNASVKVIYCAKYPWQATWLIPKKKHCLYLSVNVFCMEVLIGNTIFMFPTGDGLAILRWSIEPQKTCEWWMILNTDSNAVMTSKCIKWCKIAQYESHSQQPLVNFKIIWLLSMFLMGVLLIRWFLQSTPDKSNPHQLEPCTSELLVRPYKKHPIRVKREGEGGSLTLFA